MAAYAAVISLKQTINGLLNSSSSSSREILEFAYDEATSLRQVLERLNGRGRSRSSMERLDAVEGQMRDCANKIEDFLEFRELNIQKKQDEEEIEELIKEITSFAETTKKTAEEYIEELSRDDGNDDDEEEEEEEEISDFGMEMVGRSSELTVFRERLLKKMRPVVDLCFYSFFGEKGSGRTIVAKTVFQELRKRRGEYFDCWAWVTVGSKTHQQVLMSIISQVQAPDDDHNHDHDHDHCNTNNIRVAAADDYELLSHLCKTLENRRYMIALDDVDDAELVNHLKTSLLDESNGSLVLFTTTSEEVALLGDYFNDCRFNPRVFNETVWFCIRAAFFGSELNVPPEIEEVGKKIVENCRGRLIAAVKVMLYLIKKPARRQRSGARLQQTSKVRFSWLKMKYQR